MIGNRLEVMLFPLHSLHVNLGEQTLLDGVERESEDAPHPLVKISVEESFPLELLQQSAQLFAQDKLTLRPNDSLCLIYYHFENAGVWIGDSIFNQLSYSSYDIFLIRKHSLA